jgi:AraC-like DNA-binding protein
MLRELNQESNGIDVPFPYIEMKFSFVKPRAELRPYIQSIWVFESPVGIPPSETNLAAPNGCAKIIINCDNTITSVAEGRIQESREHGLYFVGTRDISVLLRTTPAKTCCIGIEFHPHGAYPIFGIPMVDMTNRLYPADALFDRWGREVGEILPGLKSMTAKTDFIQDQLIGMLRKNRIRNRIVEFCVDSLKSTDGLVAISDLERHTGYTRRYLEILFRDHVGVSPKVLAGIFRFQKFYRKWAHGLPYDEVKDELYDYYFDQSHFTREFKRMTGFSPRQFNIEVSNEFGRRLLKG